MTKSPPPKVHVAVIDPGMNQAEVSCFNRIVKAHPGVLFSYHLPVLGGMESLRDLEDCSGAIMFGSAASVYENLKWQDELREWLKKKFSSKMPFLGLCYGHQLVADMYGAEVGFAFTHQAKFKGFRECQLEPSEFTHPLKARLVVSHREIVSELPASFKAWANSEEVAIDGMKHESLPIWTLQSHPEADMQFMKNQDLPLPRRHDEFEDGHKIVDGFVKFVANRAAKSA